MELYVVLVANRQSARHDGDIWLGSFCGGQQQWYWTEICLGLVGKKQNKWRSSQQLSRYFGKNWFHHHHDIFASNPEQLILLLKSSVIVWRRWLENANPEQLRSHDHYQRNEFFLCPNQQTRRTPVESEIPSDIVIIVETEYSVAAIIRNVERSHQHLTRDHFHARSIPIKQRVINEFHHHCG